LSAQWWLLPLIALAGGLGAVVRALLSNWKGALPFGLLAANVLAGAFLGLVLVTETFDETLFTVGIAGFAGGLSTFAGVSQSAWEFWHRGRLVQMLLTLATNILFPVTALLLVLWLL
jgi:fluoride ion exporter CrcB/FEX